MTKRRALLPPSDDEEWARLQRAIDRLKGELDEAKHQRKSIFDYSRPHIGGPDDQPLAIHPHKSNHKSGHKSKGHRGRKPDSASPDEEAASLLTPSQPAPRAEPEVPLQSQSQSQSQSPAPAIAQEPAAGEVEDAVIERSAKPRARNEGESKQSQIPDNCQFINSPQKPDAGTQIETAVAGQPEAEPEAEAEAEPEAEPEAEAEADVRAAGKGRGPRAVKKKSPTKAVGAGGQKGLERAGSKNVKRAPDRLDDPIQEQSKNSHVRQSSVPKPLRRAVTSKASSRLSATKATGFGRRLTKGATPMTQELRFAQDRHCARCCLKRETVHEAQYNWRRSMKT
jgi:hypothetical protein